MGGGAESWSSFSPPIPALHGNPLDGLPKDELNIVTLEDGRKKERKKEPESTLGDRFRIPKCPCGVHAWWPTLSTFLPW